MNSLNLIINKDTNCSLKQLQTDPSGHTPLHLAAKHGHETAVCALLAGVEGQQLQLLNEEDGTPLHWVKAESNPIIVRLLFSGLNENEKKQFQDPAPGDVGTPLHRACYMGSIQRARQELGHLESDSIKQHLYESHLDAASKSQLDSIQTRINQLQAAIPEILPIDLRVLSASYLRFDILQQIRSTP